MKRPLGLALAASALLLTEACGTGTKTVAVGPGAPITVVSNSMTPSPTGTPSISVQVENAASALGEQGRGRFADIWGALALDGANNQVLLYATDVQRAEQMAEAARAAHPDTAGVGVKIIKCSHSAKDEHAAVERIIAAQQAKTLMFETYGASPAMDGSGIRVYTSAEGLRSPGFAKQVQDTAGPVPVTLVLGAKGVPAAAGR
ncbi:hypothetical protein [Kitasatospora sp. LaBMicrA B282]|uniref:hypothetical protein n=1 Tax=Kitasatospora sp. LaBMicrA B282 TaxID=3420949 RepID=UPI003D0F4092